jgi:hypothetical protein
MLIERDQGGSAYELVVAKSTAETLLCVWALKGQQRRGLELRHTKIAWLASSTTVLSGGGGTLGFRCEVRACPAAATCVPQPICLPNWDA